MSLKTMRMPLLSVLLILTGCAPKNVALQTRSHEDMMRADREIVAMQPAAGDASARMDGDGAAPAVLHLGLVEAMNRGVLHNWDARVAAMDILAEDADISVEEIKALPSIEAKAAYKRRTNRGASSSESVLSNTESLEPSTSAEQERQTAELGLTWNMIDAALAVSAGHNAREETNISKLRYLKVLQNIQRDVYLAYMQAAAYQQHKADMRDMVHLIGQHMDKINRAKSERLIAADVAAEKIADLKKQEYALLQNLEGLAQAEIELKSLISVPMDQDIALDEGDAAWGVSTSDLQGLLTADIEDQEWDAIMNRPELQEEVLMKNIAWRNTRQEVIKTIPGLELFFTAQYDSNSFLRQQSWMDYGSQIVQSITSVLTAPQRIRNAKNEESLADAKRRALMVAIMAQTRIAKRRLAYAMAYDDVKAAQAANAKTVYRAARQKKKQGYASGAEVLAKQVQDKIVTLEAVQSRLALQDAYVTFLTTLGRDVLPAVDPARIKAEGSG